MNPRRNVSGFPTSGTVSRYCFGTRGSVSPLQPSLRPSAIAQAMPVRHRQPEQRVEPQSVGEPWPAGDDEQRDRDRHQRRSRRTDRGSRPRGVVRGCAAGHQPRRRVHPTRPRRRPARSRPRPRCRCSANRATRLPGTGPARSPVRAARWVKSSRVEVIDARLPTGRRASRVSRIVSSRRVLADRHIVTVGCVTQSRSFDVILPVLDEAAALPGVLSGMPPRMQCNRRRQRVD